ncbi:SLC13 family permease [Winogradskyella sp. SYSU M77433]|uniref:SLC13 family permease n=1 Tax=Winogradskyella sp. SYSU M77433 TaxID=3042722 RepID=UPI00248110C4|nr:SLC13 family permease [Winogradskyella sp. SYSU M77433]MDH7913775.1 SLC13 family permease [Winogradskyella sp. SYSU M77433]|tara:strand:+ start:3547 stop:5316 length:1770 start_codon:yes stop_codon:yes gene_type:complete
MDLIITFAIIVVGVILFVKDYFSIDTTSILIMAMFIVAGVLSPEEGFSGFNHPATLTLGCIFVVSGGIFSSGILDGLSYKIIKLAKIHYSIALVIFCTISGLFSAFINDTAVVALLLPIALTVCRETKITPSMLLMPISFAALFGGTCTLIGTSTNILVSSYAKKYGVEEFGMFEFSGAALCLLAIGFVYIFIIGPILLPRNRGGNEEFTKKAQEYITEVYVEENCEDIDQFLGKSILVKDFDVNVLSILRNGVLKHNFGLDTRILAGDILKILAPPSTLSRLLDYDGYSIKGNKRMQKAEDEFKSFNLYEVIIPFGSSLSQNSLKGINFRRQYNSSVIAIRQRGSIIYDKLTHAILKEGDMLLILGQEEEINNLETHNLVVRLSEYVKKKTNYKKAIPAVLIGIGVVLVASLNLTSILISAMVGALLMVVLGILKPIEAYNAVEWKVIFMMAGVLSMGTALEKTGGATLIAGYIQDTFGQYNAHITLSLIYLITFVSTNLISSKATAALMAPIVISLSKAMEISERPLLVAVMFACSLTFMTPMSYPTNTMVYAPGNYKFNDFLKMGTPLNLIIWLAASMIIPYFFPF